MLQTVHFKKPIVQKAISSLVRVPRELVIFAILFTCIILAFYQTSWANDLSYSKPGSNGSIISLEKLLKIPESHSYEVERKAGASATEWRTRFRDYRDRLEQERSSLEKEEEELAKVAGATSAWQWAAPGVGTMSGGEDQTKHYQLRQKIRGRKAKIEELEWKVRDLEVEANLAGVPDAWRN